MPRDRLPRPLLAGLCTLPLLVLAVFLLAHGFARVPESDPAWLSVVAKNLAFGYGWSTSRGELLPFDPQITTGPALLLWVAAGIALFGNALWVPGTVTALVNVGLLTLLIAHLARLLDAAAARRLLFLLPLAVLLLYPFDWTHPLGDAAAFLYMAHALVCLHRGLERPHLAWFLLAGALAGLAVLSKLVMLILLPVLVLAPLLPPLAPDLGWRQRFTTALPGLLAGFLLALAPWHLYQHLSLQGLDAQARFLREAWATQLLRSAGSGLSELAQAWQQGQPVEHVLATLRHNRAAYSEVFAYSLLPVRHALEWLLALGGLAAVLAWRRRHTPTGRLLGLLLLAVAAYFTWLLGLGRVNAARYLQIGTLLLGTALVLAVCRHAWPARLLGAFWLLLILIAPPGDWARGRFLHWPPHPNPQAEALQALAVTLATEYADKRLVACSSIFPHEVEYALPGVNRVENCEYFLGTVADFDHAAYAFAPAENGYWPQLQHFVSHQAPLADDGPRAPVHWRRDAGFIQIDGPRARGLAHFGFGPMYSALTRYCDTVLYDDGFYRLRQCRDADIRRSVAEDGGLRSPPLQWTQALWLHQGRRLAEAAD